MSSSHAPSNETFQRLGAITREMHRSLSGLGEAGGDAHAAISSSNVQERLTHLGKITEDAANKVLNLVDAAQPACEALAQRAQHLSVALANWEASEIDPTQASLSLQEILQACKTFVLASTEFANEQRVVLREIMLAQDFQDLSGQVINKVIDVVTRTEQQMLQLLVDSAPAGSDLANLPVPSVRKSVNQQLQGPQAADKALSQSKVDDLLASLGF